MQPDTLKILEIFWTPSHQNLYPDSQLLVSPRREKELVCSQPIANFSERMPQGTGFGLVSHGTLLERDSAATWGRIETMVWTDRHHRSPPPLLTSGQLNNNNKTPSSKLPPGEGKSIHASNTLTSMQLPKELVSILELWQVRHSPTAWRRMDMVV